MNDEGQPRGDFQAFLDAHRRYQGLRDAAFHITWEVWKARLPQSDLKILPVYSQEDEALRFWKVLWTIAEKPVLNFQWDMIFKQLWTTPRRLDIAIWDGPFLCGLVAGMASRGNNVTLRFIERWPGPPNPLRGSIAPIAIDVADAYAKVLGKQWVMLKDPEPGIVDRYEDLGFSLAGRIKGRTYYRRRVE